MPCLFFILWPWVIALAFALLPCPAAALEHVVAEHGGRVQKLSGEVLIEAADGGILLATDDDSHYVLPAEKIESRTSDDKRMVPLNAKALAERLLTEMPPGFQIHHSTHYVICFNTTRAYARWCSSLLERLQRVFLGVWEKRGCQVHKPKRPLAVIVFGDRHSYTRYAKRDLGTNAGSVIGYYSIESNRIAMYDLTGDQTLRRQGGQRGSLHDITNLLSQPAALPLVATIVHEATHQIAYNSGLQVRFVDNPVWLSEGLAEYFETPDLDSTRGWRGIGNINQSRYNLFRQNVIAGKAGSLQSLIAQDKRIRHPRSAADAYAEAWAWNYFLIRWRQKEYTAYLKMLSEKRRLVWDTPEVRIAEFRKHFGPDLQTLETDFLKRMSRLK